MESPKSESSSSAQGSSQIDFRVVCGATVYGLMLTLTVVSLEPEKPERDGFGTRANLAKGSKSRWDRGLREAGTENCRLRNAVQNNTNNIIRSKKKNKRILNRQTLKVSSVLKTRHPNANTNHHLL